MDLDGAFREFEERKKREDVEATKREAEEKRIRAEGIAILENVVLPVFESARADLVKRGHTCSVAPLDPAVVRASVGLSFQPTYEGRTEKYLGGRICGRIRFQLDAENMQIARSVSNPDGTTRDLDERQRTVLHQTVTKEVVEMEVSSMIRAVLKRA